MQQDCPHTERLLQEIQAGKPTAFDELFTRHQAYLRRFVELRIDPKLRPRVSPSDVVQEAHLEAVRRLASYLENPMLPFRLWLRQIARDRLHKLRRYHLGAERRSVGREVPLPYNSSSHLARELEAKGSSLGERLDRKYRACQLRVALEQLSAADAEIVLIHAVEGLSYQETAYLLGIEATAARKRYSRALVRLHDALTKSQEGTSDD